MAAAIEGLTLRPPCPHGILNRQEDGNHKEGAAQPSAVGRRVDPAAQAGPGPQAGEGQEAGISWDEGDQMIFGADGYRVPSD